MLQRTFLHFTKVGEKRERTLWKHGYLHWKDILESSPPPGWTNYWSDWQRTAEDSLKASIAKDSEYFAKHLPPSFWWRAIPEFESEAIFLDIETDERMNITVVGVATKTDYHAFVGRENFQKANHIIADAKMIVTYNGKNFDVPVLKKKFENWRFPTLHIDLCPLLRRLGYKGGLKAVETQLGIVRSAQTQGLNGWDAVKLWQRWKYYGDRKAFETLLLYNYEDVVHLRTLLRVAYEKLWQAAVSQIGNQ